MRAARKRATPLDLDRGPESPLPALFSRGAVTALAGGIGGVVTTFGLSVWDRHWEILVTLGAAGAGAGFALGVADVAGERLPRFRRSLTVLGSAVAVATGIACGLSAHATISGELAWGAQTTYALRDLAQPESLALQAYVVLAAVASRIAAGPARHTGWRATALRFLRGLGGSALPCLVPYAFLHVLELILSGGWSDRYRLVVRGGAPGALVWMPLLLAATLALEPIARRLERRLLGNPVTS